LLLHICWRAQDVLLEIERPAKRAR
jgi:hypothetical protein